MSDVILFPFSDYWWLYGAFSGFVLLLLLLDLGVFHKKSHVVTVKESAIWSVVWVSLALCFNFLLYTYASHTFPTDPRLQAIPGFDANASARQVSLEFLTGFIIEKALAVDNIFIFVVVFSYFAIPSLYQHRVLFFGIIGALIFRAIFIALGSVLLQYQWIMLLAGVFLILTGIKLLFAPEKKMDPGTNPIVRLVRRFVPVTATVDGKEFFIKQNGVWHATPLFLALMFIEFTDVIFAVDSVPAIFAITKEPLIVFTSNIFAILGLRSLYFMLAGVIDKFHLLKYALGVILIFVGLKMSYLNDAFGGKFPVTWSLGIIGGLLLSGVICSVLIKPKNEGTSAV